MTLLVSVTQNPKNLSLWAWLLIRLVASAQCVCVCLYEDILTLRSRDNLGQKEHQNISVLTSCQRHSFLVNTSLLTALPIWVLKTSKDRLETIQYLWQSPNDWLTILVRKEFSLHPVWISHFNLCLCLSAYHHAPQ